MSPPIPSPNGKGVLIQVVPKGSPQDESTTKLVHRLRNNVVPERHQRLDARHARRRADRDRRRPRRHPRPAAALHVPRDPAVQLRAADARVPIAARAAEGRDHEPAVDRRGLRRDRRDLPVGLGEEPRRHRQGRADRGLGADDAVRDRVRPLDGLRGVPPQPHQGGVRPRPRQRRRGRARARQDRPAHHRRRRDHDLRVRQLRALRPARAQADRLRPRVRGVHRRDGRAPRARARDDGAARRPQLVVPELARMAPPRAHRRQRHAAARRPSTEDPNPNPSPATNRPRPTLAGDPGDSSHHDPPVANPVRSRRLARRDQGDRHLRR